MQVKSTLFLYYVLFLRYFHVKWTDNHLKLLKMIKYVNYTGKFMIWDVNSTICVCSVVIQAETCRIMFKQQFALKFHVQSTLFFILPCCSDIFLLNEQRIPLNPAKMARFVHSTGRFMIWHVNSTEIFYSVEYFSNRFMSCLPHAHLF